METLKVRIRKDFAPLNVAVSIVNLNPQGSPMLQRYTERTQTYEPNHSLTPLVLGIQSEFIAKESDNSTVEYSNADLAEIKWLLDGVDITTLSDWKQGTDYTISTASETKGQITINKNFTSGYHHDLQFTAVLPDKRLGTRIQISSDPVTIGCDSSSEDKYSMDFGEDTSILYNPFEDLLLLYDYKVAHGIAVNDTEKEKAEASMGSYKRTIPIHVYRGSTAATGYRLSLFQVDEAGNKTLVQKSPISAVTDNETEVIEFTPTQLTMDLRLITAQSYAITAYSIQDGRELCEKQFTVSRTYPVYRLQPINGGAIEQGQTSHYSEVQCTSNGHVVSYPERVLKIDWYTDTANKTGAGSHGEGDKVDIKLADTGIGNTYEDDWMDIYNKSEQKEAMALATDSDGTIMTDDDGQPYIFN